MEMKSVAEMPKLDRDKISQEDFDKSLLYVVIPTPNADGGGSVRDRKISLLDIQNVKSKIESDPAQFDPNWWTWRNREPEPMYQRWDFRWVANSVPTQYIENPGRYGAIILQWRDSYDINENETLETRSWKSSLAYSPWSDTLFLCNGNGGAGGVRVGNTLYSTDVIKCDEWSTDPITGNVTKQTRSIDLRKLADFLDTLP